MLKVWWSSNRDVVLSFEQSRSSISYLAYRPREKKIVVVRGDPLKLFKEDHEALPGFPVVQAIKLLVGLSLFVGVSSDVAAVFEVELGSTYEIPSHQLESAKAKFIELWTREKPAKIKIRKARQSTTRKPARKKASI
jgi:hypothetical protein